MLKKLGLIVTLGLLAIPAFAQQGAFPNYPIVGGAAYCSSTTNGTCTNTVAAGPTIVTGNEQLPANTELSQGRSPQNVLLTLASLNALPMSVSAITTVAPNISASNISGGVLFTSAATITTANITLPLAPIDGQQYRIASQTTITTLAVFAGVGSTLAATTPTVLTASTTVPQGYLYRYNTADLKWYRLQ